MEKTHWKYFDFRITSLKLTIDSLKTVIEKLREKMSEEIQYDGIWFLEESEPILGYVYIACQEYINSSINDKFDSLKEQYAKYRGGDEIADSGTTQIELIIGLANYFKHRNSPSELRENTRRPLTNVGLMTSKDFEIENSPLIKGIALLSESSSVTDLIEILTNWRQELWVAGERKTDE